MASLITPYDLPPPGQGLMNAVESEGLVHLHNIQVVGGSDPAGIVRQQQAYDQLNQFAGRYVEVVDECIEYLEEARQHMQSPLEDEPEELPPPPSELNTINYEPVKLALIRLEMESGNAADGMALELQSEQQDGIIRSLRGVLYAVKVEMARLHQAVEAYEQRYRHLMPRLRETIAPRPVAVLRRSSHFGESSASASASTSASASAPSPTPSTEQAASPTPSTQLAPSPTPSMQQAPSPSQLMQQTPSPIQSMQQAPFPTHFGEYSASASASAPFPTPSMEQTGSRKRGHDDQDAFTPFEEFPADRPAKRSQPMSEQLGAIYEDLMEED